MIKLALQNIKEKKLRTLLAATSIAIGTGSLILFLTLSSGIKNATFDELEKKSPLTQITVRPKVKSGNLLSLMTASGNKLAKESVEPISDIDGVKAVYPEIQFNNFSSIEVELFDVSLMSDAMIFGVPKGFISDSLKDESIWDKEFEPFPALVPRRILDLYNLTIAAPQGLPALTEENLIGKELTFFPNYSTFFPGANSKSEEIRLKVAGFSDKINIIGITLPSNVVNKLNKKYSPTKEGKIIEIFVETTDPTKTESVAKEIEKMGFNTQYFQKNLQEVETKLNYLAFSLAAISITILITSAIAIIGTFLATIAERKKEIGLFRALGATKKQIQKLILMEAGLIGISGSILGCGIGYIGIAIINKFASENLPIQTITNGNIFSPSSQNIALCLLFGTLIAIVSAYLPAKAATKISPVEALK